MRHGGEVTPELRAAVFGALQEDGRASYSRIAETLGTTRRLVTQIVQEAITGNELRLTVSISPDLLGVERFAYLQLAIDGPIAPVREALIALPVTSFVADVAGQFPVDVEIRVGADPQLREALDTIRQIPGVRELRTHLYESIEVNRYSPLRTGRAGFAIDEADRAIIRELQRNGRVSFRELGEIAGLSPGGARLRFERLLRQGAVKVVAIPVRDHNDETPSIGVGVRATGAVDEALAAVRELDPEFLAVTIGGYDFIATFSAQGADELIEVTDRLRAHPGIASVESWANLRVVKEQYGDEYQLLTGAVPTSSGG